jgi:hypothetical protein
MYEDAKVIPALTAMRLPRDILLDILDRTVGERSNVTASDPAGTGGSETRRWCVRFLRDEPGLKGLGWIPCTHAQIHGIRNDELKIKLAMINTDACTGMPEKSPRNIAEKGAVSEQLIKLNARSKEQSLFDEAELYPISKYDLWFYCIHIGEKYVSAEISRPDGIVAGFITSFSERIIICRPGDKEGLRAGLGGRPPVPEDFAEVEVPRVQLRP